MDCALHCVKRFQVMAGASHFRDEEDHLVSSLFFRRVLFDAPLISLDTKSV